MTPREIDALVADKVMGEQFRPFASILTSYPSNSLPETPFYSTNIAAAWKVVEKVQSLGKSLILTWDAHELKKSYFINNFNSEGLPCRGWKFEDDSFEIESDTAPMAICLAALKSVGIEVK